MKVSPVEKLGGIYIGRLTVFKIELIPCNEETIGVEGPAREIFPMEPEPVRHRVSMPSDRLRICLVEDDNWLRAELEQAVRAVPDFEFAGSFPSAEAALEGIATLDPGLVLMDINLPGINGVECLRRLKADHPQLQVLILTVYEQSDLIFDSLLAGANGYLLKRTSTLEIIESIRQVHEGGAPMTASIARRVVQYFHKAGSQSSECGKLSPREREVLELLARGDAYKQIAERLNVGLETIRMHIKHIYSKLSVHSRGEAVAKFRGWP
jgi:DNA-binding NarL/FixJ family response regulator